MKAILIMGSKADINFCKKIADKLAFFGIDCEMKVASAHKTPMRVLEIIREFENEDVVFVTVAGRSNALSGFVDANTTKPVIACPPVSESFAGMDILSSLRMPSGVAPMVVLEPENCALAVAKIFGIKNENIRKKILEYQVNKKREIEEAEI
ncbi:Phosphoribosylcarboxyaminoimidazole (NCAIR) mutase [Archaeoglobus sulfaticallidus PM70-1]|uniref:N5-carboxyaminoimidazole ribonucleotide mutase n=1 Tax=Archaeoglobus sulfaticallidus PM70-1 TaxID=387631 RepID=N0BNA6_9EURY|nr:AIR carboxylase family protein [Archaeoglobus sulfaticallidus]AGK62116.1 Phosphoribosylcarboxyaminoimidazole (NCAIR) mutase [Archaeoglobus sulfaticallidus PM70-1]